ncbi:MAG: response regulator transcription factor [Planctomycetes bacterium]|nr:response regulator transcription factor [Planctomycetota bacterium]
MGTLIRTPDASCSPQAVVDRPRTVASTRILLVEDEPLTAQVFAQALSRAGHVVDVARDGLQALRQLQRRMPNLLVLDMSLPAMSGSAVVRELRAAGHRDLPVVVVSGSDPSQTALDGADLSPGIWLTKPIKPRQLVAIVADMLGGA